MAQQHPAASCHCPPHQQTSDRSNCLHCTIHQTAPVWAMLTTDPPIMRLECSVCGVEIMTIEAGDVLVQVSLEAASKILFSGQFDLVARRPRVPSAIAPDVRHKRGRPRKLPVPPVTTTTHSKTVTA